MPTPPVPPKRSSILCQVLARGLWGRAVHRHGMGLEELRERLGRLSRS